MNNFRFAPTTYISFLFFLLLFVLPASAFAAPTEKTEKLPEIPLATPTIKFEKSRLFLPPPKSSQQIELPLSAPDPLSQTPSSIAPLAPIAPIASSPSPSISSLSPPATNRNIKMPQLTILKNMTYPDFLIIPTRTEFSNATLDWLPPVSGTATSEATGLVTISVKTSLVSPDYLNAGVASVSVDITTDNGASWKTVNMKFENLSDKWVAETTLPEMKRTKENSNSTQTSQTPVILCFRAEDTLGNVTGELLNQSNPKYESDIHFSLLSDDPPFPPKSKDLSDEHNKPELDILQTSAALIRKQLYFRINLAGNTFSPAMAASPGMNFYSIHFYNLDAPAIESRLGSGLHHDYRVDSRNIQDNVFSISQNRQFLYKADYNQATVDQLAIVVAAAGFNGISLPLPVSELWDFVKTKSLSQAAGYKAPPPFRSVIQDSGIEARNYDNKVYWKINTAAFNSDDIPPKGITVRFFTSYMNEEDAPLTETDRTAFSTILFSSHAFVVGKRN